MTNMTRIKWSLFGALFIGYTIGITSAFAKKNKSAFELKMIKHEEGWGYAITVDKKDFIYQKYIPVVEGNKCFSDIYSAKKTGQLVLKKLRNHTSPSITEEELISINVICAEKME